MASVSLTYLLGDSVRLWMSTILPQLCAALHLETLMQSICTHCSWSHVLTELLPCRVRLLHFYLSSQTFINLVSLHPLSHASTWLLSLWLCSTQWSLVTLLGGSLLWDAWTAWVWTVHHNVGQSLRVARHVALSVIHDWVQVIHPHGSMLLLLLLLLCHSLVCLGLLEVIASEVGAIAHGPRRSRWHGWDLSDVGVDVCLVAARHAIYNSNIGLVQLHGLVGRWVHALGNWVVAWVPGHLLDLAGWIQRCCLLPVVLVNDLNLLLVLVDHSLRATSRVVLAGQYSSLGIHLCWILRLIVHIGVLVLLRIWTRIEQKFKSIPHIPCL